MTSHWLLAGRENSHVITTELWRRESSFSRGATKSCMFIKL